MTYNKEKWRVGQFNVGKICIKSTSGLVVADMPEGALYETNLENAIRIVQEHNTCLGITTEALEAGIVKHSIDFVAKGTLDRDIIMEDETYYRKFKGFKIFEGENQ